MSRDDELHESIRAALHDDADRVPTGSRLDAGAAITGARRRRRPKVAIATGATAFAAVGILAISLPTILQPMSMTSTSGGAPMSDQIEVSESQMSDDQVGGAADSAIKRAPADRIALCEGTAPDAVDGASGLRAEVLAPPTITSGGQAEATLRLTNPTSIAIAGTLTPVTAGFLAVDGLVVWHSTPGPSVGEVPFSAPFVLLPGESLDRAVTVVAISCTADDDLIAVETGEFPADLPALPAGAASVGAALDVLIESPDGTVLLDLVVAAPVAIEITGE